MPEHTLTDLPDGTLKVETTDQGHSCQTILKESQKNNPALIDAAKQNNIDAIQIIISKGN